MPNEEFTYIQYDNNDEGQGLTGPDENSIILGFNTFSLEGEGNNQQLVQNGVNMELPEDISAETQFVILKTLEKKADEEGLSPQNIQNILNQLLPGSDQVPTTTTKELSNEQSVEADTNRSLNPSAAKRTTTLPDNTIEETPPQPLEVTAATSEENKEYSEEIDALLDEFLGTPPERDGTKRNAVEQAATLDQAPIEQNQEQAPQQDTPIALRKAQEVQTNFETMQEMAKDGLSKDEINTLMMDLDVSKNNSYDKGDLGLGAKEQYTHKDLDAQKSNQQFHTIRLAGTMTGKDGLTNESIDAQLDTNKDGKVSNQEINDLVKGNPNIAAALDNIREMAGNIGISGGQTATSTPAQNPAAVNQIEQENRAR